MGTRPIFHRREIEGFLKFHYQFRFNEVTGRVEIKENEAWKVMDDYQFNSVFRHIQNKGGSIGQQTLHGLLQSDFTPRFHPFRNYFKGLDPWDGKTDYIKQLADKIKTTDREYWELCLRR